MDKSRQNTTQSDLGELLKAVTANTADIVLVISDDGAILYANPIAEAKLMPHLSDLRGANFGVPAVEGKFHFSFLGEPHNMAIMQVARLGHSTLVTVREVDRLLTHNIIPASVLGFDRVGTWRFDLAGYQFFWTDLTRVFLGFQDALSPKFEDFLNHIPEGSRGLVQEIINRPWKEGDNFDFVLPIDPGTGEIIWMRVLCQPEFIQGDLMALQGTFQDITKQYEAEIQLKTSERRFKQVYDNAINGLGLCKVITDENGTVVDLIVDYINPAFLQVLLLREEDVLGKSVPDLIYWKDDGSLMERLKTVAQTGEAVHFIYHTPTTLRHYGVSVYRSTPNQLAIDIKDITETIDSREALVRSEKKYRQLFENSINGFSFHEMIYDDEGKPVDFRYLDVNSAFETHTGIKAADAIGKLASEVLPGIEKTELFEIYAQVAATGEAQRFETYYEPLNRYYIITAFSPEPNKFATIFADYTVRIRAEKAIQESEKNFRSLFDSMLQGVVYQDDKGRIISANKAAEHILGYTLEEMTSLSSFDGCWKSIKMNGDILPGAEHPAMIALRTGKTVEGYAFGLFNPRRNDFVWIDVCAVPQFHEGEEEPYQVFTTFLEITDQIRVQQALEERIKELHSLAKVNQIIQQENDLEVICTSVAEEVVKGLRYPELAVATVDLDGLKCSTNHNILETPYKLAVPIEVGGEVAGQLAVFYIEDREFIQPEELNLLEGVADRLGLWCQQQKTQERLLESERRFRTAMMVAPNPIMIHAEDGEVIEVNDAWLNRSGYAREELKTVADWIRLAHPEYEKEILDMVKTNFKDETVEQKGEYSVRAKSGETLTWYFTSAPLGNFPDGRVIVETVAIDITHRVKAEEEKRQYFNRIMALREIDQLIVSTLELDKVLDLITSHLGKVIKFDSMSILSIDGDYLEVIASKGFGKPDEVMKMRFPSAPGYPNYVVIKDQIPLALSDVSKEYPTFQQPTKYGLPGEVKAWLGVPLINQHEVIGMFTIDRCYEEPFTEQDIGVAMQYANRAAIAITNARLFEETNNHLRKLEVLRKIDGTITSSQDISDALHTVLEQVKGGLNVDVASVFLVDESKEFLAYQQSYGYRTEGNPDNKVPIGQGYVGTVAARMEPIFVPQVDIIDDGHMYPFSLASEGIVSYYGLPLITKGELQGVLQILQRSELHPSQEWIEFAEALAAQTAIAVENLTLFKGLQQANEELREAYEATIKGWAHALEIRDKETEGHSRRVVLLTEKIAEAFGFEDQDLVHLRRGVLLHDIGKMGVPDQILHKPGPLDESEWEIMRQHPVYAYEMLKPIIYLRPALSVPHYHHERWDGSGYPEGLKGEAIPLEARIFAVVDAYDALTSDRPYRGAWSQEETIKYLQKQAGKEFDPTVVEKFLEIIQTEKFNI